VAVVGTSAGGGLAVALMVLLRDAGRPLPSCSILFSPAVDVTFRDDVLDLEAADVILSLAFVRSAGRIYAGDLDPDHPIVSPINADLAGLSTCTCSPTPEGRSALDRVVEIARAST